MLIKISWKDISKYEWKKSKYMNCYTLVLEIKSKEKNMFYKNANIVEFVFHRSKVEKINNYISKIKNARWKYCRR